MSVVAGLLLVALGIREYRHGHTHGSDDHTRGSDDHTRGSDDHTRGSDDHTHGSDDHTHDHDAHTQDHGNHADAAEHSHGHGSGHDHAHDHPSDHGREGATTAHSHGDTDAPRTGSDAGILARVKRRLPFVGSGHDHSNGHEHAHGAAGETADRGMLGIAWFAFVLGFAHEEEFEIIALCTGSSYCLELMSAYALTVIAGIVGLTLLLVAGYQHFEERVERYTPYLPVLSAVVLVGMGVGFLLGLF